MTLTGTLTWDETVPDHHGWLLHSEALLDGAACIPAPDYSNTDKDADLDTLTDLVAATLQWEGYADVASLVLTAMDDGYAWTADS